MKVNQPPKPWDSLCFGLGVPVLFLEKGKQEGQTPQAAYSFYE